MKARVIGIVAGVNLPLVVDDSKKIVLVHRLPACVNVTMPDGSVDLTRCRFVSGLVFESLAENSITLVPTCIWKPF